MVEQDSSDFEIGSVENFHSNKDEQFSHSSLVMTNMRICINNGCKEMTKGWTDTKIDKNGNLLTIYHEDSRLTFIESVKTLISVMACDLDDTSKDIISKCEEEIGTERRRLADENDEWWKNLYQPKKIDITRRGEEHLKGKITHKILIDEFDELRLEKYRSIFSELSKLSKRLDFWKAEIFEA